MGLASATNALDDRRVSASATSQMHSHSHLPVSAGLIPMPQEEKRPSLLDVVRENLNRQGKTTLLYRVVVCGDFKRPQERADLGVHYQKLFKHYQSESDLITGMFFMFDKNWIHIVEASQKVANAFLRDLSTKRAMAPKAGIEKNDHVENCKVLCILDDITQRHFPFWASRIVEAPTKPFYVDDSVFAEDSLAKTMADICMGLSNVGIGLSSMTKNELKNALEEIAEKFRKDIPATETIAYINALESVVSIDDWMEIFDGRIKPPKDDELVWPAPKMIMI